MTLQTPPPFCFTPLVSSLSEDQLHAFQVWVSSVARLVKQAPPEIPSDQCLDAWSCGMTPEEAAPWFWRP